MTIERALWAGTAALAFCAAGIIMGAGPGPGESVMKVRRLRLRLLEPYVL